VVVFQRFRECRGQSEIDVSQKSAESSPPREVRRKDGKACDARAVAGAKVGWGRANEEVEDWKVLNSED
jgi:hypothetical protein